jgi:hypothetical protein
LATCIIFFASFEESLKNNKNGHLQLCSNIICPIDNYTNLKECFNKILWGITKFVVRSFFAKKFHIILEFIKCGHHDNCSNDICPNDKAPQAKQIQLHNDSNRRVKLHKRIVAFFEEFFKVLKLAS